MESNLLDKVMYTKLCTQKHIRMHTYMHTCMYAFADMAVHFMSNSSAFSIHTSNVVHTYSDTSIFTSVILMSNVSSCSISCKRAKNAVCISFSVIGIEGPRVGCIKIAVDRSNGHSVVMIMISRPTLRSELDAALRTV